MNTLAYLAGLWRQSYHWRRAIVIVALAALLAFAAAIVALSTARPAGADPLRCVSDRGLWLFKGTVRTLCDTPVTANGSWTRYREFWTPAHQVPLSCTTFGGYYSASTSCTGGYWQERTSNGIEQYPVDAAIVLPDEPGHIS